MAVDQNFLARIYKDIRRRFHYTSDPSGIDKWVVTKDGNTIYDDCDGWALTSLYDIAGRSWFWFWFYQITFQAVIWKVKSYNGGWHAVLWYRGYWTDNMEVGWYETHQMRHTRVLPYVFPLVALKMLLTKLKH